MFYLYILLPFLVDFAVAPDVFKVHETLKLEFINVFNQDHLFCAHEYDHGDFKVEQCVNDYANGIINACIYMVLPSNETVPGRYVYGCAPLNTLPPNCSKGEDLSEPQNYYFPYATIKYNGSTLSGALFCCGDDYCNESEEPPISAVRIKAEGEWADAAMDTFPVVFCIVAFIVCVAPQFAEFVDKVFANGRKRAETAEMLPSQANEPVPLKTRNKRAVVKAKFTSIKQLNEALKGVRHPENYEKDVSDDDGAPVQYHDTVYNYRYEEHQVKSVQRVHQTNKSRLAERMIEHGPYEFTFDLIELAEMFDTVSRVFGKEPTILDLPADTFIFGNLEGSYADLFRWLNLIGWPPRRKVLFLGGLTSDKQYYSLETISLIFALKLQCPQSVFVVRGTSECSEMDLKNRFPRRIANALSDVILRACHQLPVAATIAAKIFCSHGGIPLTIRNIRDIRRIRRPINDICKGTIEAELIFSVVSNQNTMVAGSRAHMFDPCSAEFYQLLARLQILMYIRSRNPVREGYQFLGPSTLSIWSTPDAADHVCGTVVSINHDKMMTILRLQPSETTLACTSETSVKKMTGEANKAQDNKKIPQMSAKERLAPSRRSPVQSNQDPLFYSKTNQYTESLHQ